MSSEGVEIAKGIARIIIVWCGAECLKASKVSSHVAVLEGYKTGRDITEKPGPAI